MSTINIVDFGEACETRKGQMKLMTLNISKGNQICSNSRVRNVAMLIT